jgi:curved DNA-binding protein CbpA
VTVARSYYSLLQIADDAKSEEIRMAWARAMAKLKPRVDAGEQEARGETADLTRAYETLSNPSRRHAYDLALEREKMDRDAAVASMRQDSGGFWTGGKIGAILLILIAIGGFGYYRAEQKRAAIQAAADAEKRAEMLAEQDRALKQKDHDELYAPLTDEEKARLQAKQDAEIRRLQNYSNAVGNANVIAERRQAFDQEIANQQKQMQEMAAQRKEQQDAENLQRRQDKELAAAQRKLQQLQNN